MALWKCAKETKKHNTGLADLSPWNPANTMSKTPKRLCYACDLKDDSKLMAEYKAYHAAGKCWPEITKSITDAGIVDMSIFLTGNRMFLIMDVDENVFDPTKKAEMDASNPKVVEWETLMWKYQQALPWAKEGEKWTLMEKIFQLGD